MPKQDPKESLQAQENLAQEAQNEQEAQEKGFFQKAKELTQKSIDKVKEVSAEATNALLESSQNLAQNASGFLGGGELDTPHAPQIQIPSLKSIEKKYKLVNCLVFVYVGAEDFALRVGSASYTFSTGEVLIVPNDSHAQWLKRKDTLFVQVV